DDVRKLVADAGAERDLVKGAAVYKQYQQAMVDAAHHFVLIQPIYQVAVRKSVSGLQLTAAGWMAELGGAKPALSKAQRSLAALGMTPFSWLAHSAQAGKIVIPSVA